MNRLSTNLEDYLEIIGNLLDGGRRARISDIARLMGVSRPSVTQIVGKLTEIGLVTHEPYGDVRLTEKGREIAKTIALRHGLFNEFLCDILGVPSGIADKEACLLEHAIGPETTARFAAFVHFVDAENKKPEWLRMFHRYLKDGILPDACIRCQKLRELEDFEDRKDV